MLDLINFETVDCIRKRYKKTASAKW